MKFPYSRSGRTPISVSQLKASLAQKMSPAMAWGAGLAFVGGVALFAISQSEGGFGAFLFANDGSTAGQIEGMTDNDGNLVHAVYSAGMVQDLGTFGAYQNGAASGVAVGASNSRGGTSDLASLYSGGFSPAVAGGGNAGRDVFGSSNLALALAVAPQGFRSASGAMGGWGGGARSQASGLNYAGRSGSLAGGAGEAALPANGGAPVSLEAKSDAVVAATGDEEDTGKVAAPSFVAASDNQAALLADVSLDGGPAGVAAGVPEVLSAEGVVAPDGTLASIQADAVLEPNSRVPDAAATWTLFAAALAGLTIFRRISA